MCLSRQPDERRAPELAKYATASLIAWRNVDKWCFRFE
jgi:hypothetical protein